MFLNAPKLQLLNVLFLVIEDVLPEGVSFQDLHVGSEAIMSDLPFTVVVLS